MPKLGSMRVSRELHQPAAERGFGKSELGESIRDSKPSTVSMYWMCTDGRLRMCNKINACVHILNCLAERAKRVVEKTSRGLGKTRKARCTEVT